MQSMQHKVDYGGRKRGASAVEAQARRQADRPSQQPAKRPLRAFIKFNATCPNWFRTGVYIRATVVKRQSNRDNCHRARLASQSVFDLQRFLNSIETEFIFDELKMEGIAGKVCQTSERSKRLQSGFRLSLVSSLLALIFLTLTFQPNTTESLSGTCRFHQFESYCRL